MSTPIILASSSSIRQQLLSQAGIDFMVQKPAIDEQQVKQSISSPTPQKIAQTCAYEKALSISRQHPKSIVIGADQVCTCNNKIFEKPITEINAVKQLSELSGKTHQLLSSICIVKSEALVWEHLEIVTLTMKNLTESEVINYIKLDQPLYSCGSYKYEENGQSLFTSVNGSSDAIQGLPLQPLIKALKSAN